MDDPGPTDVGGGEDHPLAGVVDRWEAVIDDMEVTATEYRDAGWTVVELHPGDVTPLPPVRGGDALDDDRVGLDILVPDDEFEAVEAEAEAVSFDSYEVYRAQAGSIVFAVTAIEATAAELAVLVPLYYRAADAGEMAARATERGRLDLFVRPLADDRRVVFSQEEPALLLPAAE
ncbi:DUF7529 family protein [Salinigranum halophilum]|uniref:DUF7529 family protein n=1 Tax=Salinigranum halophilum TaxID=2565931 RepID=UPI0010A804F3|nr:hypothetical protein [Salinigranum halophilum]